MNFFGKVALMLLGIAVVILPYTGAAYQGPIQKPLAFAVQSSVMKMSATLSHASSTPLLPAIHKKKKKPIKKRKAPKAVLFRHIAISQSTAATSSASTNLQQIASTSASQTQGASTTPQIDLGTLNTETRAALVNIICTSQTAGTLAPITGSGIMVDPRGVVLTNAHVAQYFLLRDYPFSGNVQCQIRTGSPAGSSGTYTAELLYLPTAWVNKNASQITSNAPMGTGEDDFAFLLITGSANNNPMPSAFPYLPMDTTFPQNGEQMLLASYPAGFISGMLVEQALYASSAFATVGQLFVFNTTDQWVGLFSIPGTVVSQAGSSGGAAVRTTNGKLLGIITTETIAPTTGERDLRAVTLTHIDHALQQFGQNGINALLSGDISAKAADFNANVFPALFQKLINAI